jgi:hypothetical protein
MMRPSTLDERQSNFRLQWCLALWSRMIPELEVFNGRLAADTIEPTIGYARRALPALENPGHRSNSRLGPSANGFHAS